MKRDYIKNEQKKSHTRFNGGFLNLSTVYYASGTNNIAVPKLNQSFDSCHCVLKLKLTVELHYTFA